MLQSLPRLPRHGAQPVPVSISPRLRFVARLAIAAGAGVCAFALFSWSARAADWQHDGTYETGRGRSGTFHHQATRQPSLRDRQTQWTNQNGGSGSQGATSTWNRPAGTASRNSHTTLANGKSAGSSTTASRIGPGQWQGDTSRTGFNGKTATAHDVFTKTADGHTTSGSWSTGTGKSGTYDASVTHDGGSTTRDQTWTNGNGQSVDRDSTLTRTADGYDQHVSFTGPGGNSRSIDRDVDFQ